VGAMPSEEETVTEVVAGIEAWSGNASWSNATAPLKHLRMMRGRPELLPSTWSAYFLDMHLLAPMTPVGLYFCLHPLTDAKVLLLVYTLAAAYLSAVMTRTMVLLCPAMCICAALGLSAVLKARLRDLRAGSRDMTGRSRLPQPVAALTVAAVGWLLVLYLQHAVWCASAMYSSRSGGVGGRARDGWRAGEEQRAGLRWMAANLPRNATVAAWPDTAAGMAGRARGGSGAGDEDVAGAAVLADVGCGNDERLPWPLAMRRAGRRCAAGPGLGTLLGWTEEAAWGALRRHEVDFLVVAHALEQLDTRDGGLLRAAAANGSGLGDGRSADYDAGQAGGARRGTAGGAEEADGTGRTEGQQGGQGRSGVAGDGGWAGSRWSLMHKLVKHRCVQQM
jgi:hypothetical protein